MFAFLSKRQFDFIRARAKHAELVFIHACKNNADFSPTDSLGIEQIITKQVLSQSSQILASLPSYYPYDFCLKRLQSKSIPLVQPTRVQVISSGYETKSCEILVKSSSISVPSMPGRQKSSNTNSVISVVLSGYFCFLVFESNITY